MVWLIFVLFAQTGKPATFQGASCALDRFAVWGEHHGGGETDAAGTGLKGVRWSWVN